MSLSDRIASLAARIGIEVKTKIDASHPGLARAWVSFGYVNGQMVMHGARNVVSVERLATGRYRVHFTQPMPDTNYAWIALARSSTVEVVIAAVQQDKDGLASESADLIYHFLVTLVAAGVSLDDVARWLESREGRSGLEEKAWRGQSER